MTRLLWDQVGSRLYETGVDRGVLYLPTGSVYARGFAWNGLTTVTESPSGAEATAQYADNRKYLNLLSAEEFGATIEAFSYPPEFGECDGTASIIPGLKLGQQARKIFGLSYRTRIGNDVSGSDYGYKIHLVYGALAAPSEKAYATVNDSPEALAFSWEITTTPVVVPNLKPTSLITINSTLVDPAQLTAFETILYGGPSSAPRLPLPAEVFTLLNSGGSTGTLTLTSLGNDTYSLTDTGTSLVDNGDGSYSLTDDGITALGNDSYSLTV